MRKLLLVLPIAAILLAAGVLFAGLGRSLANTEIPAPVAEVSPSATPSSSADPSTGTWVETGRKPLKIRDKSIVQKPTEPYTPGSRR